MSASEQADVASTSAAVPATTVTATAPPTTTTTTTTPNARSVARAAAFEREATRLMAQHVYRTGIREEWLREEDEAEGIYIRLADDRRMVSYPSHAGDALEIGRILSAVGTRTAIVTRPSSIDLLFQQCPHEDCLNLSTGEHIPIFKTFSEVCNAAPHSGRFLLREPAVAISYGPTTECVTIARQTDSRLVSALFEISLREAAGPILPTSVSAPHINIDSPPGTPYHHDLAGARQRHMSVESIRPALSYPALSYSRSLRSLPTHHSFKREKFIPDAQQVQWLETLKPTPKPLQKHKAEEEKEGDDTASSITVDSQVAEVITEDPETGEAVLEEGRTTMYIAPLLIGLALAINLVISSLFVRDLILETLVDFSLSRVLLFGAAVVPRFFVSQFFCEHVILTFAQLIFPVSHMHRNSLFYSSQKSKVLSRNHPLPHFTIQMPCYKEGLSTVLAPSLHSVHEAVQAYRLLGGTANIVISEDGLRLLDQKDAEDRISFYENMGCGWIARPANGENGYERRGRFKKASNLNYSYAFSTKVEYAMTLLASKKGQTLPTEDMYQPALEQVLAQPDNTAWACGDIRIGDYILLIDSDTRVPVDCLMDAANELERSPDVAALQHCSGITYVQHHYFERLLGYFVGVFTNFSISWVCANGACAPLMGHNVFLRWTALQEVQDGPVDDQGEPTIFSAKHVSEDYELAMRLQMSGYCVRWATYSNQGFKEGVSLNPNDEKARWQKYAFGACEIVFNPFYKWFYRGPLSALFWRYLLSSKVHASAKAAAVSYLSSYFAIAVSLPITLALTVAQGLFWPTLDPLFRPVFDTWISVVVIFNGAGTLGLILCRSRSGHQSFFRAALEGIQHTPAIVIFFMGIAYHLFCSVAAFFLSVGMTWGATSKDYQQTTLLQVIRRFWHCYLVMAIILIASGISLSSIVPLGWRIQGFTILFPLFLSISLHFLFPIILDPGILHKFMPRYYASRAEEQEMEQSHAFFYAAQDDGSDHEKNRMTASKSLPSKLGGSSTTYSASVAGSEYGHAYSPAHSRYRGFSRAHSIDVPLSPMMEEVVHVPALPRMYTSTSHFSTTSPFHDSPRLSLREPAVPAPTLSRMSSISYINTNNQQSQSQSQGQPCAF